MLLAAIVVFGALSLVTLGLSIGAFRRRRFLGGTAGTLLGLLLLALAALFAAISLGTQGYRALTREVTAATVTVYPMGGQRFEAMFEFPDGREVTYALAGDQLYVDAHILKWKPIANLLGLHTAYELDRVGGRYEALDDERAAERTVYSLKEEKPLDVFPLRQRFTFFAPLLDAEYGSATFTGVDTARVYEVRVSTTGLLIRPRADPTRTPGD